ncbi:hypothetical protein [Phyllobacterium myrsinacearum]|uniref:Type II toxin-antitoxin system PemK/MazF family toxin n=1 Tax=Phyllobacterium myrsinacearum TaxID=28101 RepID=A0A839EFM2_9HYPH|nr:hypothetical protein [Phyllobacterium myrsinacearum]MBA8878761.1 hypothetical protein [Phyllobacterium myrsinacearum]
MLKPGDVLEYHYLWARQADIGEESGRKARPVCLLVRNNRKSSQLVSVSTHIAKAYEVACLCRRQRNRMRRAGPDFPSWLILDEYNYVDSDKACDFVSTTPLGAFSEAFLRKIAILIKQVSAERRVRAVLRT